MSSEHDDLIMLAERRELESALAKTVRERDEARAELAKTSADFHDVWESRDEVIEERERARQACNAYWHDLTRIALLCAQTDDQYPLKAVECTVRERDEALAQVARREREHEALLETAQKALARVEAERDGAKAEAERMRDERDYWERRFEYADAHLSEAFNLSPMDNLPSGEAKRIVDLIRTERDEARAKADTYERDWYEAKSEFGTATAKLRDQVRELTKGRDELKARLAHAEADAEQAIHNEAFMERQRVAEWIRGQHARGSLDCSLSLMALDALRVVADEIERGEHER